MFTYIEHSRQPILYASNVRACMICTSPRSAQYHHLSMFASSLIDGGIGLTKNLREKIDLAAHAE